MAPPKPRSKRAAINMDDDADYSPLSMKKSRGFKGEPMFLDSDGEEEMNGGFNSVKKMKIGQKNGFEEGMYFHYKLLTKYFILMLENEM